VADDRKARYRDISDGLLRQRRNLLLISLLTPLFFLSGASIDRINILGTIITINNPEVVKYSLVILFGYFLLRYWQYYQEETYVKDMHREMHQYLYHREMSYLNKKAREKAKFLDSEFIRVCFADPKYSFGGRFVAIPENIDRVIFPFMRECEFYIYPSDDRQGHKPEDINKFHSLLAEPENANWFPIKTSEHDDSSPSFYREYLKYSIIRFNMMRFIGACQYMFNKSYFTDYQLPFIVAVLSAAATVYAISI
jgi:hypothetical protein